MANPYKDANGHWTTKENDGGPCQHTDGKHQTKIEDGKYYLRTSEDADWEEVSYEEFNEVREGGYSPFDEADDKLDFGFDDSQEAQGSVENNTENSSGSEEKAYKSAKEYEDFEDARYYPTKSNMEGNKWVGSHYSIAEAHGLTDDNDTPEEFNKRFKSVGKTKSGADIFQGPDGYYSGNPRINTMAFKTQEALQDYEDKQFSDYAKSDSNKVDAYKQARQKISDNTKNKINEQVEDGVTEDDIGYLRQVLKDIPEINQLSNNALEKIITAIRNRQ